MAAITTNCTKAPDTVHKAMAEVIVMMLFTLALSLLLIRFPFFSSRLKQQFHLHSRPLISERPRLNQDTRGLRQRGTCRRICCWNAPLRLRPDWAQGGESGRYLFESLNSVWWCPHGCRACYPWIKTQLRRRLCGSLQTCQRLSVSYWEKTLSSIQLHVYLIQTHNQCFGDQISN